MDTISFPHTPLAATLLSKGFPLKGKRSTGVRTYWIFEKTPETEQIMADYNMGQVNVNVELFVKAQQFLHNQLRLSDEQV